MGRAKTGAGKYRHRLRIEKPSTTGRSSHGSAPSTYDRVGVVWGEVLPTRGTESWLQNRVFAKVSHIIRIRHNPEIGPHYRLVMEKNGRIFGIVKVVNMEEFGKEMELMCVENANV